MHNYNFEVSENTLDCGAKIKVIGVGGCGGNMINHLINTYELSQRVDIVAANTDAQDIYKSKAQNKIQLGIKETNGRGAGAKPEVGRKSAEESIEQIRQTLEDVELLLLVSGLGGGTGTGAAPVIANLAKNMGILVISVVTMPFKYEGSKKLALAKEGLKELKKESDAIIEIHNQKLLEITSKTAKMHEAMAMVDNILVRAISGIITILLTKSDINVDFADVKTVMEYRGTALMSYGKGNGENGISDAYRNAIETPLLGELNSSLSGAKGLIVFVKHGVDIAFHAAMETLEEISSSASSDVMFIPGVTCDESLAPDEVEMIIIATGFDESRAEELQRQEELKKKEEESRIQLEQLNAINANKRVSNGYDISKKTIDINSFDFETPTYKRMGLD